MMESWFRNPWPNHRLDVKKHVNHGISTTVPSTGEFTGFLNHQQYESTSHSTCHSTDFWVFPKIGVPQNGWFIMEHPIKMDDLGGKTHYFRKHPYTSYKSSSCHEVNPPTSRLKWVHQENHQGSAWKTLTWIPTYTWKFQQVEQSYEIM